jgi:ABC-type polysaccharide/polyol phosphate transport system ATPase subunit
MTTPTSLLLEAEKLSKAFPPRRQAENGGSGPFWALKDLSFEVKAGVSLGIIGPNGAGKSTLLKILAGIYQPTSGRAILRGRVGAILDVGSGFHPELSGRENIFFAGQLAGMSRRQVARLFDPIVAFSELEGHLEKPVKHYSSGMFLRLAFATLIHIEQDLLLLDEVLSVGDAAFQEKCLQKLAALQQEGRTMIIISHDASRLAQVCSQAMVLAAGQQVFRGHTSEALAYYARHYAPGTPLPLNQSNWLQSVSVNTALALPEQEGAPLRLEIELVLKSPEAPPPTLALAIMDSRNIILFSANTAQTAWPAGAAQLRLRWEIPSAILNGGLYWVNLYTINKGGEVEEHFPKIGKFDLPSPPSASRQLEGRFHSIHLETKLFIEAS